jgi:hypothetical protein
MTSHIEFYPIEEEEHLLSLPEVARPVRIAMYCRSHLIQSRMSVELSNIISGETVFRHFVDNYKHLKLVSSCDSHYEYDPKKAFSWRARLFNKTTQWKHPHHRTYIIRAMERISKLSFIEEKTNGVIILKDGVKSQLEREPVIPFCIQTQLSTHKCDQLCDIEKHIFATFNLLKQVINPNNFQLLCCDNGTYKFQYNCGDLSWNELEEDQKHINNIIGNCVRLSMISPINYEGTVTLAGKQ